MNFVQTKYFDFGDKKINLFSFRSLFICGEEINFTAFVENKYGGIISILSRKCNFGGINLPKTVCSLTLIF